MLPYILVYIFTVYSKMVTLSKDEFDATASTLYGDSDTVLTAIEALFDSTDSSWTVTINGETYTYSDNTLTNDVTGEEVSSLSAGEYTVVLTLAGDVSFTEDSLLGLGLYYVTGAVTAGGGTTTEVVYVYLMDPVYGTVCVYQLKEGGTINGETITEIDTTYENKFGNVTYDFSDEEGLNFTFYQSTDHIGADGIILTAEDEGYNDDENLFSAILKKTDYVTAATGWNWNGTAYTGAKVEEGTAFFENQDVWYTVSAVYTYNGTTYEAACVVSDTLGVESYTVTLTLLAGYTWADGTDGTKTFTFYNYTNVASKSKATLEPTYLYGDSDTVLAAIETLFDTTTGEWTVTINGETYTYESNTLTDAAGDTVSALSAGGHGIDYRICFQRMNLIAATAFR